MSRDQGRILAAALGILIVVVTAIVANPEGLGISKQVAAWFVIVNAALAAAVNYLPNVWKSEPAPLPGNPTGAPNP